MLLTRAQVRERLGIGKDEFLRLVKTGELRSVRTNDAPNSPFRVPEEALEEFLERKTHRPDEPVAS